MPAPTAARSIKVLRNEEAQLRASIETSRAAAKAIYDAAIAGNRDLTDDEKATVAKHEASLRNATRSRELLDGEIADALAEQAGDRGATIAVRESWRDDPNRGYKSQKELLLDVRRAAMTREVDPRLATLMPSRIGATAGSDEHSTQNDPYGGFLIPTGLMPGVKALPVDADPLAPLTTKVDMTGVRTLKINARVDKDHSTSVSGGLTVYRRVETQTVAASRTKFEQVELQKNELMGVTYASEELLAASPIAFASLLAGFFADEFGAKVFEERLNGDGAGRYHGIANSPALVTVSKESGQANDTILFANIVKMIAQCWRYGEAVWIANPTCYPQLRQMTQPGSTIPIFATGQPGIATLEGRPIYFHERAAAIGDLGDIILVNPREYLENQDEPIMGASSVHVRFLEHEQTFKFWTANAGAGWWRTALTPKRGVSISPFVYLEAR